MTKSAMLVVLMVSYAGGVAQAQPPCFPHELIVERLAEKFGENQVQGGLTSDGQVAELFLSRDSETWTITITSPGMSTCIVLAGTRWQGAHAAFQIGERR